MVLCLLILNQSSDLELSAKAEASRILRIAAKTRSGELTKFTTDPKWEVKKDNGTLELVHLGNTFYFREATGKLTSFRVMSDRAKLSLVAKDEAEAIGQGFLREAFRLETRVWQNKGFRDQYWHLICRPLFQGVPFENQIHTYIHMENGQVIWASFPKVTYLPPNSVVAATTPEQAEESAREAIVRELRLTSVIRTAGPTLVLSALQPIYQDEAGYRDLVPANMRNAARDGQCYLVYKMTFAYDREGKRTGIFVSVDAKTGKVLTIADQRP